MGRTRSNKNFSVVNLVEPEDVTLKQKMHLSQTKKMKIESNVEAAESEEDILYETETDEESGNLCPDKEVKMSEIFTRENTREKRVYRNCKHFEGKIFLSPVFIVYFNF